MDYWILKVDRKREIEAREDEAIVSFFVYIETDYAQDRENIGVQIMQSTDSRLPQVGQNLGDGLFIRERRLNELEDRIDVYVIECVCPYSRDEDGGLEDNDNVVNIDFNTIEYNVNLVTGVFAGYRNVSNTATTSPLIRNDLPLFKVDKFASIQSSSGEAFEEPLIGTVHNLIISITQEERGIITSDRITSIVRHIGSVNSHPITIAGFNIPEREALIRSIKPTPKGRRLQCSYEIEVVIDKPLYKEILDNGDYYLPNSSNASEKNRILEYMAQGKDEPADENDPLNDPSSNRVKLNSYGKVLTGDWLGVYLAFWGNKNFKNWNVTLDLPRRLR